mgnify:CR=1 FL=1
MLLSTPPSDENRAAAADFSNCIFSTKTLPEIGSEALKALEEGDTIIVAKPKEETYAETLHTFFVAQVGYHLLAHNYPQYVSLSSFGEGEHK